MREPVTASDSAPPVLSESQTENASLQTSARRQELLQIAAKMFAAATFSTVSVSDLARAFGIQKATFYHHFHSKEELLREILETGIAELYEEAQLIASKESDPIARLRALLACHAKHIEKAGTHIVVYQNERDALPPDFATTYRTVRRRYDNLFVSAIQDGQSQGVIRAGNARIIAYGILGMYNGLVYWYRPEKELTIASIHEILVEMTINGIVS